MPNITLKRRNGAAGFDELLVKAYWDWEDKVTLSTGEKVYELTLADITGPAGADGADGDSLGFNWSGTLLGVNVNGGAYQYVDLKGDAGADGSDANVTKSAIEAVLTGVIATHSHNVSKADVGLGDVPNYGVATQAEAEAGTSDVKLMTPLKTKQAIDELAGGGGGSGQYELVQHYYVSAEGKYLDNLDFKNYEYKIVARGSTNDDSTGKPQAIVRINGSNQYGSNYKFARNTAGSNSDTGGIATYYQAWADSLSNSSFQTTTFIQSRVDALDTHIYLSVEISAIKRTGLTENDVDLSYGLLFSGKVSTVQAGSYTGVGDSATNEVGAILDSRFTYTFHPDAGMSDPDGIYLKTGLTQGTSDNVTISLYRRKITT